MKLLKIIAIFFFLSGFEVQAKKIPSEKPKLVVMITIDQMKYNHVHEFWNYFGDEGFKKLITEGTFCKNAHYSYLYTQSSVGYATIATGTTPTYHGIISDYWFDRLSEEIVYSINDAKINSVGGSYEAGKASPSKLLSSTFSDELRLSNHLKSKVFGVSLNAYSAVLSSGHTTDATYWIDPEQGNWISSSYYLDTLPSWVNIFNNKELPDIYLDRSWSPVIDIMKSEPKNDSGAIEQETFMHNLSKIRSKKKKYNVLKASPFGNTYTMDFGKTLILEEELGKDDYPDYLTISLASNGLIAQKYGLGSLELKDAYVRLDNELSHFIEFIDLTIGLENTLIVLTSDRGASFDPSYLKEHKIPSGYFDFNQSLALLKSYLNIIYGKGKWVQYYYRNQLYLNRNLIEDSKIELREFQDKVAQFMIQFNGVANAITAHSLQTSNFSSGIFSKFQRSFNQNRSGDVLINLEPGWIEKNHTLSPSNSSYTYDSHVPLVWYGWKIMRNTISRPVNMVDIAPTLSNLLEISNTNACIGNPIIELVE